jgi:hypothetical protein
VKATRAKAKRRTSETGVGEPLDGHEADGGGLGRVVECMGEALTAFPHDRRREMTVGEARPSPSYS